MGMKPGGRPDEPLRARLRAVDWDRGEVVRELAWDSPIHRVSGPTADQEFTAATLLERDVLLQPTHTEILWICPETWKVIDQFGHPLFSSVHSAAPRPDGGLTVSCAGNESVLEFDRHDQLVAHHWLGEGDFAAAYPGIAEFRTQHHDAFKPHSHHPNYASHVGDDLWVTCFETAEAFSLTRPERRIGFPEGIPHDGRLIEGLLWFTVVTGHVIAVDPVTLERRIHIDLRALSETERMLGWCRGVEVVGRRLFVGLTMLRATRHREVLRWLVRGEAGRKLPTRILEIDLDHPRIVREVPVGNAAGGTIYGIIAR